MATTDLTTGWTAPIDHQLLANDIPLDVTGMTVELVLTDRNGVAIDTSGDITVEDAATGKVRYNPDPADIDHTREPYTCHWKVTDGGGKVAYFPNGGPDVYRIFKA
jgi:hypothetical protein